MGPLSLPLSHIDIASICHEVQMCFKKAGCLPLDLLQCTCFIFSGLLQACICCPLRVTTYPRVSSVCTAYAYVSNHR